MYLLSLYIYFLHLSWQTTLEFCLAPVVGYIADAYSVEAVFLVLGVGFLLVNALLLSGGWGARSDTPLL